MSVDAKSCDPQNGPGWEDYRDSHLHKGADYDRNMAGQGIDGYMADRERLIVSSVIKRLFAKGVGRYLDFACGTGRITQFVEGMADESYGVDVSATMLEEARNKCRRTKFFHRDITRETVQIPEVDLVSAFRFFGNAQNELRLAAIRAIHTSLVDDGYLILDNHKNANAVRRRLQDRLGKRRSDGLSHRELQRLLKQNGFKIRHTYGIGLWIIRDKYTMPHILQSRLARTLEPISMIPGLARYCPNYIVVAQKHKSA